MSRLTLIEELEPHVQPSGQKQRVGLYRCTCGNETAAQVRHVRSGATRSCGCLQRETATEQATRHGLYGTGIYRAWANMIQRTTPGGSVQQRRPGYIGVGRDPRWDTFEGFYADMGATWFEGACLARHGDTGDYNSQNARWITRKANTQERNERQILRLADGRSARAACLELGIVSWVTGWRRIRDGWTAEDAIATPARQQPLSTQQKDQTDA